MVRVEERGVRNSNKQESSNLQESEVIKGN